MVFGSSQGVSLVSIPGGEMLRFWELVGASGNAHVYPSPDETVLVAVVDEAKPVFDTLKTK